jgi:hypothetical protein
MANTRAQKTAQNLSTLTTAGDIAYASAAGTPARLGIGSSAQVLTVASGVPSWATAGGGGKVLQVVFASHGSAVSSTSATYATTNVTASITPSSASSKVMILGSLCIGTNPGTSGYNGVALKLVRDSTDINLMGNNNMSVNNDTGVKQGFASCSYLDSPATTSATTYVFKFARPGAGTVYINADGGAYDNSTIILMEIGA